MSTSSSRRSKRPVLAAVVLGTALSAFGAESIAAAETSVGNLSRYCTTCWKNARLPVDSWGDCTQEVFRRLLERVPTSRWELVLKKEGEERSEFLRAIDAVKKRTQRARRFVSGVECLADKRPSGTQDRTEDRELVELAARDLLSDRQQRILQLSLDGWSPQEIADRLVLPVERVSDEKYKAIRKLQGGLATRETT